MKLGDGTVTAVNIPIAKGTNVASNAAVELVSFSLTPKAAFNYTPTLISFYAGVQSFGDKTGANNDVLAYEILNGSTTVKSKTNISVGRNDSGTGLTQITASISEVECVSGDALTLKIYLRNYNQSNAKNILLYNVAFAGSVDAASGTYYDMTVNVDDNERGTASVSLASVLEGSSVTFNATSNPGYKFVNWTNTSTSAVVSTENPYTIASVSEAVSLTANFETAKMISYSVSATNNGTRTDNFAAEYADDDDKFIAPTNLFLSSDNQTLTGWNDGTTTYAVGAEIDCSAGNKTLTPVFATNSGASFAATLDARTAGFTTTWNFGSNYAMFIMQNVTGYYVKQATINGASVDIPMYINTKPGKFNTEGDNTARAQINNGTVLRVPVVDGSVVTLTGLYAFGTTDRNSNPCTQTTINGVTTYDLSNDNKTATYTYSGTTGTIDIVVGGDMAWGTSLSVTYPSPYSVTYDGNGATSGTTTDANLYDKNAEVTIKSNSFVKTGYAFFNWNTEADGSGTSYAAGEQITITGNTTLYAQWLAGSAAAITYTLADINNDANATTITSVYNSTSDKLTELAGITNNTGGSYGNGGSKANLTVKIPTDASYNADHYMSVGFTVADGYKFTPSSISIKAQPVTTSKTVKLVLTDGVNSIEKIQENVKDGIISTVTMGNSESTTFSGNVTLKIYCYGADNTYRLGSPITITGAVSSNTVAGTITASGYNTFSSNYPLDLSTISGGTAYVASSVTDGKVVLTKVDDKIVAAGTGLMIAGTAGDPFTIGTTADAATFTGDNLFVGMPNGGEVEVAGSGYNYVFGWTDAANPGFYKVASDVPSLEAGKAYLHTTAELGATPARLALSFEEGETTGIQSMDNGQWIMDNVFDLQGRRVAQPTKGLYIINGHKVVVK